MGRIVSLDEVDAKLRNHIASLLHLEDEAVVLPQASRSPDSGALKSVVFRLGGEDGSLSPELFSSNWFCGVSLLKLPKEKTEQLLADPARRAAALKKLVDDVPSELVDSQLQVGPGLEGAADERDASAWVTGFDGPSCCVGIYSAVQSKAPEARASGMSRAHNDFYLVAKAGSGLAGQTFHARLTAALRDGKSLNEALGDGGSPGAKALRRVASAAKRNRARLLKLAADSLGFFEIDTIGDNASPMQAMHRMAIPMLDCVFNSISRVEHSGRSMWQYAAGASDGASSSGIVVSSNVAEGFVVFLDSNGKQFLLKNEAHSCVPFASPRLLSCRDAVFAAVDAHKAAKKAGEAAHPDDAWLRKRFSWKNKDFGSDVDLEPPCLWGSHEAEAFLAAWGRELGASRARAVRLQPELVALSGVEPGKLRVALKAISKA